jgi:hypothetical protein
LVAAALTAWPAVAHAVDEESGSETGTIVLLLLLVGVAYLTTHFVVGRLQTRLLVVAGVEYIILGILLGPAVPQIHALDDLAGLLPIIALAAGWVGLVRGMEINLKHFGSGPEGSVRLAVGDDLVAGLVVAGGAFGLFASGALGEIAWNDAWLVAGVLGCTAATGSTEPIEVVKRRYHVEGKVIPLLRRSARAGDALALFVFGLLFCIFRRDAPGAALTLSAAEWALVAVGTGALLGVLFLFFLGEGSHENENGRFLTLVGVITFASGAAYFLDLSPLLVNLVLGIVLVTWAPAGTRIQGTLERTERPMSLVLLLFAGALWRTPDPVSQTASHFFDGAVEMQRAIIAILWWIVMPVVLVATLRFVGKIVGSRLAAWGRPFRADLYRGLIGHGDVTVAMAISFRLVYEGLAVDVAYTVIIISVVLHDLIAPRMLRSLLVDAGELQKEQAT